MRKLITIYIFLILSTGVIAQSIYEKNGYWGVQYGANINIPKEKSYYYGSFYSQENVLDITHKTSFGHYASFSRSIKLLDINETNILLLVPAISYSQITKKFCFSIIDQYGEIIESDIIWEVLYKTVSLNLGLKQYLTLKEKNAFFYTLNFEAGFFYPYWYSIIVHLPSKMDWLFCKGNISIGHTFNFQKISLSPFIQYEIFIKTKTRREDKSPLNTFAHPSYDYYNIKSGIILNF